MQETKPVSASELAAFEFCQRAWAYDQAGHPSEHQAALERGRAAHHHHVRLVRQGRALSRLALILILMGLLGLLIEYL